MMMAPGRKERKDRSLETALKRKALPSPCSRLEKRLRKAK